MAGGTRISTTIELGGTGPPGHASKQAGYLRLPHSVHRSAYGHIPVPIVELVNGDGPGVLLMAGNHGDEYEGQIALHKLARSLEPELVRGRLTILPAANLPAVKAGSRTSPIDAGNLNRSFPGDPDGSPTAMLAHYIETALIRGADWVLDIHSGGSSLVYVPSIMTRQVDDHETLGLALDALRAFGAPLGLVAQAAEDRTVMAACARQGAIGLITEIGGGGTVTRASLDLAEQGIRRVLHHIGLLREAAVPPPARDTRLMRVRHPEHFLYAEEDGLFEPLVELGETVAAGQPAARIHAFSSPSGAPDTMMFATGGMVVCKRVPCLTERGDCLFHLAVEDHA